VYDLETSRIGAPYIYDISNLRVKKLDDDQKYWTKMEMLGIMRRAKRMVFQPQYAQL
jgi:hypothetical protein